MHKILIISGKVIVPCCRSTKYTNFKRKIMFYKQQLGCGEWKEKVTSLNHKVTVLCVEHLMSVLNSNILKSGYIKIRCDGNGKEAKHVPSYSHYTGKAVNHLPLNKLFSNLTCQILSQDFNIFRLIPCQTACDWFFCFAVKRFITPFVCWFCCMFTYHCHQQG